MQSQERNTLGWFLRSEMSWHCFCMLIFHCLLLRAFDHIACHSLPALRTMVWLCGEFGWWWGRGMDGLEWGPPYYPESSGPVGGFRSRFERGNREGGRGELAAYQSGCQAVGHRAKRGKQATRWKSQVSETNLFHRTAPQYPPSELEYFLAISCWQPGDPLPRY